MNLTIFWGTNNIFNSKIFFFIIIFWHSTRVLYRRYFTEITKIQFSQSIAIRNCENIHTTSVTVLGLYIKMQSSHSRIIHSCEQTNTPSVEASSLSTKMQVSHSITIHNCEEHSIPGVKISYQNHKNAKNRVVPTREYIHTYSVKMTNSICKNVSSRLCKIYYYWWLSISKLKMSLGYVSNQLSSG